MTNFSFFYITNTKTRNGLKKELIKKYKECFNIASTTRIYNLYDRVDTLQFDIEKAFNGRFQGGTGYIKFEIEKETPEKVINVLCHYSSPQDVSR